MGTNVFAAGIKPVYPHPATDNVEKGDEEGVTFHKNQSPHFKNTVADVHEYTANYLDGPNDMKRDKDGTYITKFNEPVKGNSIFSDIGDYSSLSHMKISFHPSLGLQGNFKSTFIPKSQNEPWLGGKLDFDGLYPVSASLFGSTLGDFPNGNYGAYVRFTFPPGTDARAMGKAINWDTVGAASHLTWSFLGVNVEDLISAVRLVPVVGNGIADTIQKLFGPVFDMGLYVNFPLQWYPRWARWSVEDPNSLYMPIRGVDYPKVARELHIPENLLPDVPLVTGGYASFIAVFDSLGRLNINQIPGLSEIVNLINKFLPFGIKIDTNIGASTDGPVEGHGEFNLDHYSGNLSSSEVEQMIAEGAPKSNDFNPTMQGVDNSPGKLLTKHALSPSETNRFLLKYNAEDNTQVDSGPGLIVPSSKRDMLYAYIIKGMRKQNPFPNQDIQTWSSYFSPIDGNRGADSLNTQSQVDANGQYINNDKQQEFQEIDNDQYTMSLPGANFKKRRVVMDYVKDGNFTKYDHGQFVRVIDFFKRADITPKISLLNLTATLLTGDPDDPNTTEIPLANYSDMDNYYDQWMKVYYNGTAPPSKAWGGQKGPINDNTLLVYQYLDPTQIKLNTKEPTKVNVNGSLNFTGHGLSNVKAVKNLQLWYKVLPKGQSPYTNPDAAPSTDGWQKGPSEDIASGKTDWSINTGNLTNLGQYTVYVRAQDNYGVWSQDNLETQHVQTNKTVDTLSADFEVTDDKVGLDVTKKVVDQTKVPNPKDADYKDNVTGLPGDKFRYHIRINATNGTTDHIVFRDNDFDKDQTEYWDDKADNYMLIHHNDGTSDEKVKLIGEDFTDPNTIDFSKRFKSDQIGNGAYIDLYFTTGTVAILTPVGTVIPNTAYIVSTSGGDNDGHGWASNTANISLYPDPSMTKQVKLAADKDAAYTDKLEASPDSDLDYRVQIKPNKDVKDPELNEIKLSDPFDNKLNQGLTLKKVTANYYDADNKIINDQTEVLTPDSHQVVALSHPVVPGGHVDIVYQVHLDQAAPAGTTFKNIAYMESSSYGKNPDHQLPNWQTNNAQVTVANSDGTVNFKYVDLDTGKEIAGHNPVQVTGKVDHKVSEYTNDQLAPAYIDGYTVMKEQIDDQAIQRASKADPVIAQKPQTYTYYYEKAALSMEAPKNWNFGRYNTSQTEATYYLPARQDAHGKTKPYTVDVHDAYGVKDWTLKVQQKHQFTGINPTNKKATVLSGAQLNFTHLNAKKTSDDGQDTHPQGDQLDLLSGDQFKLPVGNETPTALMSYHNAGTYVTAHDQNPTGRQYDNPGVKSFAYQFGDRTNAGYSIGLHVPASTKREATDYTTTLTWSLSVAP